MLQCGCVCTDIIGTGIFGKQGSSWFADCSDSVRPASGFLVFIYKVGAFSGL